MFHLFQLMKYALSLNGFKYNLNNQPLEKKDLHLHYRMRLKEKVAQIEVHDGQVLQIRSRDANCN